MLVEEEVSLLLKLVDLELQLHSLLLMLVNHPVVIVSLELVLFVFLDTELQGLPLLGKNHEQLFELLVHLCLCLGGHFKFLLDQVVPLLQLSRYLRFFLLLLLLSFQLLS